MKFCRQCQTEKSESDFNRRGTKLQPWCRPCQSTAAKNLYAKDPERFRARKEKLVAERMEAYHALKAGLCCTRCPENDVACLDFHHTDPSKKEIGIGNAARWWTLDRLKKEIAKCEVLCSNCHRKHHYYEKK